jgi:hypothetical protein
MPGGTRNSRGMVIGVVAALLLIAVVAVPSFGATKQFTFQVTPASAVGGGTTDFEVKVTNTTPGNSTINSFKVDVPFPVTGTPEILPPPDSSHLNPAPTISVDGNQVRVQNIDSLRRNQFLTLKISATPAAVPVETCSYTSDPWVVTAYAGNSLNGDTFTAQNAPPTTEVLGCITLQFVAGFEPADGTVATGQTVKVEAVANGVTETSFTGDVTIEKVSGPGSLSGNGPVAAVAGVATFSNFQGDTAGDYVVKATSPGVADSPPTESFTLFASELDCENLSDEFPMEGGGTTTIGYLDPADCTTPIPFTFSYDPATNTFTIEKEELTFGLEVTVVWPPEVVPGAGEQLQIPPTEVQPPTGFAPVEWCLGTPPSSWTAPEGESWCIFSQQAFNQGPSGDGQLIQVTDGLVLFGDANGRR